MAAGKLDYIAFVDDAMRKAVRNILLQVEKTGLPGQNHFFVSYRSSYKGVVMSDALRNKYPEEITIVLQHQFWGLKVEKDCFRVSLSFNNIPEELVIPFAALTAFADPSAKFSLHFQTEVAAYSQDIVDLEDTIFEELIADSLEVSQVDSQPKESAEIITLDAFRKK
ncbi:MAG: ClpXP protease specificity-enhancing factor SspB [Pseudomonadota bacterium]